MLEGVQKSPVAIGNSIFFLADPTSNLCNFVLEVTFDLRQRMATCYHP